MNKKLVAVELLKIAKKLTEKYADDVKKMSLGDVKSLLEKAGIDCNHLSFRAGIFTIRKGYFYSHGYTSEKYAEAIANALRQDFTVIDQGDVWKAFKGGAPVEKQSHWWVKFS